MSNHQVLNNITHKDLRIITEHNSELGDTASYTNVLVSEFSQIQAHYPIFFRKNTETAKFEAIALFGFASEENLFLDDNGWHARYVPLTIQRRPFLIGFQTSHEPGEVVQHPVVHIDVDSPRVSQSKGEAIFLPQGGQSDYLQNMSAILNAINQGHQQTDDFINQLLSYDLIESVNIKVTLDDGSHHELANLYTVNEERLDNLDAEVVSELHAKGYLKLMHFMIASMSNLSDLIELKNNTLA